MVGMTVAIELEEVEAPGLGREATYILDARQREAVEHREGPCLVLAGPGSGKTRVIVERFLALHREGAPLESLQVLTYTVKAAREMADRAEACLPDAGVELPLTNFHSFARRIVREWGWSVGVPTMFRTPSRAEQWEHASAVLDEWRPSLLWHPLRPEEFVDPLLTVLEQAKQELIGADEFAKWAETRLAQTDATADPVNHLLLRRHVQVAEFYRRLAERYARKGLVDYDDQILLAWRMLEESEAARKAVCGPLRYVMVDEFQDTNYAQGRLVERLAEHGNLLVVADDDQSIYKFRGASLANVDGFGRRYPQGRVVLLDRNYRSTPEVVEAAGRVIGQADVTRRREKEIAAVRPGGAPVEVWLAATELSECAAIASECRRLIGEGTRPADIAWLFFRHADMTVPMKALREAGVPYRVTGGRGFFVSPEVKDVMGLLRAVEDPDDSQALLACLHLPAWRVSNAGRLRLVNAARASDTSLLAMLTERDGGSLDGLAASDLEAARQSAADLVELHGEIGTADCRELLYSAVERSRLLDGGVLADPATRDQAGANLNKLGELLESFCDWATDLRLSPALRYLEVVRDRGREDELAETGGVSDAVSLMTAHAAKGLEFPVVFISHCIAARWPGRSGPSARFSVPDELVREATPDGDVRLDEVRRLFYVASSRAMDRLVYSAARRYRESFRDEALSPFLGPREALATAYTVRELPLVARPAVAPGRGAAARSGELRLSVEDLRAFKECPRRYEYRRRYQAPTPIAPQAWFGSLVHHVLEAAGRRVRAGENVDGDAVARLWAEAWASTRGPKGALPELREFGERSLRAYVESPGWASRPFAGVEERFSVLVDGRRIVGRFDRLDVDGEGGRVTVVDYKTGAPRTDATRLRSDLQVKAYAQALAAQTRQGEVAVELHYLQDGSVVRMELDREQLRRARFAVSAVAGEVEAAWAAGSFPARPAAERCRRCPYRLLCTERADEVAEGGVVALASTGSRTAAVEAEIPWE
jgi:DNA helicase-2/ATP-dependent DNA helicase PcrA